MFFVVNGLIKTINQKKKLQTRDKGPWRVIVENEYQIFGGRIHFVRKLTLAFPSQRA
jgi:hypothetical protein